MTWLLKGLSVGTVTFFFLTMLFIIALLFIGTAKAIGTTAIYSWTLYNPLYWLAFFLVLAAACAFFKLSR
jgi:hypothetical protein